MRHLSLGTERAYSDWIKRFILFHKKRHPKEMGTDEIRLFLSRLAVDGKVAASTQNVALCAILFLYRDVLGVELPYVDGVQRAKRPARIPVVFTRAEAAALLSHLSGTYKLIVGLLYSSGLRLMEALRLRVKDLDFGYMELLVRDGRARKTAAPRERPPHHPTAPTRRAAASTARRGEGTARARPAVTRSATVSPRICSKTAMTFAPFKSC
jgi:integrase